MKLGTVTNHKKTSTETSKKKQKKNDEDVMSPNCDAIFFSNL